MEYALGLEPKQRDAASQLPVHSLQTSGGFKYLTLTYRRPIDGRPDLIYLVGVSGDLIDWNDSPSVTTLLSVTPGSDGKETVIVRDNVSTANQSGHFIRLMARTAN